MKKTFILTASLVLLVSCSQTLEITDEENGRVSPAEITLSTMAKQTRAIAEGTTVPTDNAIGFLPNFHSDISSGNPDYGNEYNLFGYHTGTGVWRCLDKENPIDEEAAEDFDISPFEIPYKFSPIYWPAGDRVFMDYVAFSYSNIMSMFSDLGDEQTIKVKPVIDNPNRMSVRYECNLPFEDLLPEDNILYYGDVAGCAEILWIMKLLGYEKGVSDSFLTELSEGNFLGKYGEAIEVVLNGYDIGSTNNLEGDTPEAKLADARDVLNRGYWFYTNHYPLMYKFMQDDLLYAHDRNLKNDNHGSVKATFNHAKAWVKVIINNQTQNDFLVRSIRFNDVKSSGTLVIDNSKSAFEAYWDFPQAPASTGASIAAYIPVGLDSPLPDVDDDEDEDEDPAGETYLPGIIPDQYLVPANCYGPAISVNTVAESDKVTSLEYKYLNGSQPFSLADNDGKTMVSRLSGMMFPAQEPGNISIKLSFWEHDDDSFVTSDNYNTQTLNMSEAMQAMGTLGSESTREISLNLPRQTWQMGKVYVYVLTIGGDEITINPFVTEWEYADPIIGPDQTGMRTDTEATEVFNDGGDISDAFGN